MRRLYRNRHSKTYFSPHWPGHQREAGTQEKLRRTQILHYFGNAEGIEQGGTMGQGQGGGQGQGMGRDHGGGKR